MKLLVEYCGRVKEMLAPTEDNILRMRHAFEIIHRIDVVCDDVME